MAKMTLDIAAKLVDGALAEARGKKLKPMTVVVLDAGGHAVALKREDGAALIRPDMATAKAWGVLAMGRNGRAVRNISEKSPAFFSMLLNISGGKMSPMIGGVLVRQDGETIGAIGVTGDSADNDEACAVAALGALGLDTNVEA